MKSCPTCGASAGDEDVFCEVDGARLASSTSGASDASPVAPTDGGLQCGACGAKNSADGDGYCGECGYRLAGPPVRSMLPSAMPAKIGEYTVVRGHGDGDIIVKDAGGATRLLLFGPAEAMQLEASALSSGAPTAVFPEVISQGEVAPLGSYIVVRADVEHTVALDKAGLSFPAALALVRALVDAAHDLESRGFAWEPVPTDLHVSPDGHLQVMRVRRARRLAPGESLNVKRVLETLGTALVPTPLTLGTPGLLRLVLPRSNFSTAAVETVDAVRKELAAAEATMAVKGGDIAELVDPGLRRDHNEDATALAEGRVGGDDGGEPFKVLVVCDGVSSSTHAEQASSIAAKVARDALTHFARSGDILREGSSSAVAAAIRAAHVAVCTSQIEFGKGAPPGTTIVAALVFRKNLTVGWVGDSRAYWVSPQGADLCTTDHSWANEAVARGEVSEAAVMQSPLAHALTRCLGPLENDESAEVDVEPGVRTKALPGPGKLVLCTDGLWNYFAAAPAIAGLVQGAGKDADPAAIARFLVCNALAQGGGDNVSVAVLDVK